nr:helix-turn-helix domain-containing protein [Streptomyces sp. NBC_01001]
MRDDELLTVPEVMARLKIGRSTLYEACYTAAFAGDDTHGPSTATVCTKNHHGKPHPEGGQRERV